MKKRIAVTGIGVLNGSLNGVNHLNQSIYDCTFDRFALDIKNPDDLIKCATENTGSGVFKNGFNKSAVIQLSEKSSTGMITGDFAESYTEPDFLSAYEKTAHLLDIGSVNSIIIVSSSCAVVLRDFDIAVSGNDRIYSVIDKSISIKDGEDCKDILLTHNVSFLTICCDNLKTLTSERLTKTALLPTDSESIAASFASDYLTGLITTSLCIYNRYYPGQSSFELPSDISKNTPFYFPYSSRTWFKNKFPRKAVLSIKRETDESFLFFSESGIKAPVYQGYLCQSSPLLFPVFAESKEELKYKLSEISVKADSSSDLQQLAKENYLDYKLAENKKFIAVVIGDTNANIKRESNFLASGIDHAFDSGIDLKTPSGSYFAPEPLGESPPDESLPGEKGKTVFVYPGVASAYTGLGQDLFQMFPDVFDFFSAIAPDVGSFVKQRELYPGINKKLSEKELKIYDKNLRKQIMEISQCGVSFSVIYTMIMTGVFNLFPEYALGYSMGEASMMASLMVWEDPAQLGENLKNNDAFSSALSGELTAVRKAWDLPLDYKGEIWESYTLLEDREKVIEIVNQTKKVYITLINTDNELVIAGEPESCLQVIKKLGCKYFPLQLDLAIHSKPAYLAYDKMVELYSLKVNKPSGIKLYSSSCYLPVPIREKAVANSIAKAFCDTVDFPRLINKVYNDGGRIFIETGPRHTCSLWIEQILKGKKHLVVPLNVKGVQDQISIAKAVSMLISHKVNMNIECLYKFLA